VGSSSITMLRREAEVQALRARRDLGVAMDRPVDIYRAIRAMRLWLLFQPLDGLFGMYQRQDTAAGVVISVKVHPALQRYTAAHELGHHVMGHEAGIDPERNITRWTSLNSQELGAQMFAAEFLMPLAAVNAAASSLGIGPGNLGPLAVYQLSLRLRTSYSAMITRLQTLSWVNRTEVARLRSIQPKQLKAQLLGRPPTDSRSDVWLVTDRQEPAAISPLVGDEVLFSLEETPSTGYRWDSELAEGLAVEREEFVEPEGTDAEEPIGGPGRRRLYVAVKEPLSSHVRFSLRRQWETLEPAAAVDVALEADNRPQPGVDTAQQPALLAT
jgi:Zn-dependent peptidase ImmA (M78 family)/predicted secreted protein